jgi:uncharacterized protein
MMIRRILLIAHVLCFLATACLGSDIREVQWDDLVPELPPYENPLTGLTEEETGFIEYIIYLREYLPEKVTPEDQEYYDEMIKALSILKEKGIDVDKIIALRRSRNFAVNSELDGKQIRLAGYLLPLDMSGNTVTDFLLVPYVGACVHTPPPPPNQIVHAVSATSTPYEIDELFKPVWVVGRLEVKSLSKEVPFSDGSSDIDIGYSLSVEKIGEYKQ